MHDIVIGLFVNRYAFGRTDHIYGGTRVGRIVIGGEKAWRVVARAAVWVY